MQETLKMKQLVVAQWTGQGGVLSYSTLALGEDGAVYRFDPGCQGWIVLPMVMAECDVPHRR